MHDAITIALQREQCRRELPRLAHRRRLRRDAGLTQAEIARALGVAVVSVLSWEHGLRTPSRKNATKYRKLLDRLAAEVRDQRRLKTLPR